MMPSINLKTFDEKFSDPQERLIVMCCLNGSKLRRTKPVGDAIHQQYAKYVWRITAFAISPEHQHQCMPVLAFCDLPLIDLNTGEVISNNDPDWRRRSDVRNDNIKYGNDLADKLIDCFSMLEWHGVHRWERALGMLNG